MNRKAMYALMFIFFMTIRATAGMRCMAPKPSAPPNIVLIAIDTLRRDHLGCYGYNRPVSPNIDRFAKQGVLFERCYSPASWTLPSFTSMFTGLLPSAHGVTQASRKLLPTVPTVADQLKKKGYYCTAIVSNPCAAGKYGLSKGFDVYDDYSIHLGAELGMFAVNSNQYLGIVNNVVTGDSVTQQAILQLTQAEKTGKPFFMFVLYFDPHDSYIPPAPMDKKFDPKYKGKMDGKKIPPMRLSPPPDKDLQHLIARYDGEILYTDMQVAKLLKKIDGVSKPDNTIVIIVSDHGEAFAEHKKLLHGNSAYREEVCVPMIWRWSGVLPQGRRAQSLVLNMDIAKTLAELIGFDEFDLVQGESLWPDLLGKDVTKERAILSQKAFDGNVPKRHLALTRGNYSLHIQFKKEPFAEDSKRTMYDIVRDPWETTDIFESHRKIAKQMLSLLKAKWDESLEIRKYYESKGKDNKVKMTPEERRRLETMGYLNKAGKKKKNN